MNFLTVFVILAVATIQNGLTAPANQEHQSQLNKIETTLQNIQTAATVLPNAGPVSNLTQQLLTELQQYRQSNFFFGNPCQYFQNMFRILYCSVASTDPQRQNPIVQQYLQFLLSNQQFFNAAEGFFCQTPFAVFGTTTASPAASGGASNGNTNAAGAPVCSAGSNSGSNGFAGFNGAANSNGNSGNVPNSFTTTNLDGFNLF